VSGRFAPGVYVVWYVQATVSAIALACVLLVTETRHMTRGDNVLALASTLQHVCVCILICVSVCVYIYIYAHT
jgi:hypothetical protein